MCHCWNIWPSCLTFHDSPQVINFSEARNPYRSNHEKVRRFLLWAKSARTFTSWLVRFSLPWSSYYHHTYHTLYYIYTYNYILIIPYIMIYYIVIIIILIPKTIDLFCPTPFLMTLFPSEVDPTICSDGYNRASVTKVRCFPKPP